jgi:hypothetical protein
MKKLIVLFAVVFSLFSIAASAQNGNGNGGNRREMMKQRLKDSLQLTDVQSDSVVAIQQEFQPRVREIMMDQSLDPTTKATKVDAIMQERRPRLKSVLTDDQISKFEAMEQRMRAQMRQRMNNGGTN